MLPYIIRPRHIKPNTDKSYLIPNLNLEPRRNPESPIPKFLQGKILTPTHAMSNQENKRGNSSNPPNLPNPSKPNPNPAPSTSNTQPNPASLASRIQTSATGLAKSAFNPGADIAQTLASSTSSKTGPSALPNTQTSRDLSATTQHGIPRPGSGSGSASAAQAFREHEHDISSGGFALPALTEDEFQRNVHGYDGIEDETSTTATTATATPSHPQPESHSHEDLQTPSSAWKGKARAHDPTQHQLETVWQRQWHAHEPAATYTPNTDDGAAVVSLLSDTSFDPNFEDPTTVPDTEIDIAAAPGPLSAAEREALDSFRKGMGLEEKEGEHRGRLTGASLVPDIDVFLSQGVGSNVGLGEGTVTGVGSTSTSTSLRDDVLMNLPGAGDWIGVQERYHDEVWGYLQPVLEDARVEIEKGAVEGLGGEDGPAVRRLKMILMHMKG